MTKVKDTRTFKYQQHDAIIRTRSTPTEVFKTIELPIHAFFDLGLKLNTLDGEVIIENRACKHQNLSELGEFMLTGYECEDCGEVIYK